MAQANQTNAKSSKGGKGIGTVAAVAVAGTIAGAVAGVLLAPKSGKETRSDIKQGVEDKATMIKDKTKDVASKAKSTMDTAKLKASLAKDEIKSKVDGTDKELQRKDPVTAEMGKGI